MNAPDVNSTKAVERRLRQIRPSDGWWKSNTEGTLRQALEEIPEEFWGRVEDVIAAIREEYGE